MTNTLAKRGPDDEGYFDEPAIGLSLGHRRLAILDLSPLGHQPMMSPSGRFVIVFNGEVYNHTRLRPELEANGVAFRGTSDTEVVLAAIECWGLRDALSRFIGMFSFALWDRRERELSLVRDRVGIKPLYYGWVGGAFVFGSELKALRAAPGFANRIDRSALALLLRHNYIAAPYSIYENIRKLMPGTVLSIDAEVARAPLAPQAIAARTVTYWSAGSVAQRCRSERLVAETAEAVEQLEFLLRDSAMLHMEADVPLGAFLSGGVDSSTVVALMQAQSSRPIKTFAIGFKEFGFDEAPHARAVAHHLGTDHTELYVTAQDALSIIPGLARVFDEPFADSSQIPTALVSELTRRYVTVSLSGDGGDELFGGYERYFWARQIWDRIEMVPEFARHAFGQSLRAAPDIWAGALKAIMPLLPHRLRVSSPRDKVRRLGDLIGAKSPDELYAKLVSHSFGAGAVVLGSSEFSAGLASQSIPFELTDFAERMMFLDLISYLPDDILTKVDRASMAASLEARVPLLDHRVVEFAWRLPLELKIHKGVGKWLLREVLFRHVPRALIDRPKKGFSIPVNEWLRGPLREWAETLLGERRLHDEAFLEVRPIRTLWLDHVNRKADNGRCLWNVLMFQAWLDAQGARCGTPVEDGVAGSDSCIANGL